MWLVQCVVPWACRVWWLVCGCVVGCYVVCALLCWDFCVVVLRCGLGLRWLVMVGLALGEFACVCGGAFHGPCWC